MPLGQLEQRLQIEQLAERLAGGVVFINERIAGRRQVIADRRVVLAASRRAVAPVRPRIAGVRLTRKVRKIDRRRRLGHRYAVSQRADRPQECFARSRHDRLPIRQ